MNISLAFHLLVIEDDPLVVDSIRLLLPKNWRMTSLRSLPKNSDTTVYHAAMIDMHLRGENHPAEGPQFIKQLVHNNPNIEAVAMSGDLSLELMETCLKNGASKFLAKPLLPDELMGTLEKIEALWQMRNLETRGNHLSTVWLGQSQSSDGVRRQIASLRGEPGPILIEGETGTGKEVAFRLLNQQEPNRPTITVNIASIPEALFESEIFGHVKGAFTGADSNKMGLAEAAHGGDLFFDEIEALPLSQQVKLLRFLESGEIRRVGSKEPVMVKVRVIAASNQKLQELVKEEKFREDLFFRLGGKKITLPPLRQRTDDIPELAKYFLSKERPRINKFFAEDSLEFLKTHHWPGNVRELKRVCEQVALMSPLPVIRPQDVAALIQPSQESHADLHNLDLSQGLGPMVEAFEATVIRKALLMAKEDVEKTCDLLKISRSSLYQKIKNYKLQENA